jgi:hypothetical protein
MTGSAKQSSFLAAETKLDCFVASLLAMTVYSLYFFPAYDTPIPARTSAWMP